MTEWKNLSGGACTEQQSRQHLVAPTPIPPSPTAHCEESFSLTFKMEADRPQPTSSSPENSVLFKITYWHKLFESDSPPRLGIDVQKRMYYATMSAFSVGMLLGYYHGSKKAGLRFRAENAHRFPTTSPGWYLYHRAKNHITIVGGVKEGTKLGCKLGAGALAFCLFEETVDYARHEKRDFLSTVTAGLSFSGIYSLLGTSSVSAVPHVYRRSRSI